VDCVNVCARMIIRKGEEVNCVLVLVQKYSARCLNFSFLNKKRSSGSGWQGCVLMACMGAMCGCVKERGEDNVFHFLVSKLSCRCLSLF
jgi:hypothetical protein